MTRVFCTAAIDMKCGHISFISDGGGIPTFEKIDTFTFFIPFWFKLTGDDANVDVQQVLEDQILMGQGPQIATQEFNERFFLP